MPNRSVVNSLQLATLCVALGGSRIQAAPADLSLQEIVVTAQKRSEDVQDVPISMSAFSGAQLREMGVQRVTDVLSHVPNVDFYSFFGEAQTPSMCFRSICLNQNASDSFESPVALYIDDVYVGSAFAQSLQLFDVDRIEVLKGPQGTLYGRNTIGGVVKVVTRQPTKEFEMQASGEYGSHDTRIAELALGGPLSDRVRGRIATQVHKTDGWVKGVLSDGSALNKDASDIDTLAVRGMLNFDVTDTASFLLSGNYFRVEQGAQASSVGGALDPTTGETCSLGQLETGDCVGIFDTGLSANELYGGYGPRRWLSYDIPGGVEPRNDVETYGATGTLKWDVAGLQLVSVTGYSKGKKNYVEDLDGDIQVQVEDRLWADVTTWSEDLRLSHSASWGDWLVGAFYYDDRRMLGTELFPVTDFADHSRKDTESKALYANAEIPIAPMPNLHVLLGVRYTDETTEVSFGRDGDYVSPVDSTSRGVSSDNIDWRAGLQFKPNDALMMYGSVTTSFRSANINNQFIFGNVDPASELDSLKPVKPEHLTAYEAGLKTDFWDGRARLNAATFYYDVKDLQYLIWVIDSQNHNLGASRLRNLEKVDVWGAEAELVVKATDNLQLTVGGGFTKSQIDSTAETTVGDALVSLDGKELPMSNPSANASISYRVPLSLRGGLSLKADYSWKDNHYFSPSNTVTGQGSAYDVVNLRAVWNSEDERYSVELYGENVFDTEYYLFTGLVYPDTINTVWGRPAWYGVRLSYTY